MQGDSDILRELYMLTGKVDKDKNYLYYLLIKDGITFRKEEKKQEPIISKESVSSFEDWFSGL